MITMALIVLLGLIALAISSVVFMTRRAAGLAAVVRDVEKEVAAKLRRDEAIDDDLAEAIESGLPMDRAISDFQSSRASLLPNSGRTSAAYQWDEDDVADWRDREITLRGEEVNRRLMTPAIGVALAIVAVTTTVVAVNYGFFSSATTNPPTPTANGGLGETSSPNLVVQPPPMPTVEPSPAVISAPEAAQDADVIPPDGKSTFEEQPPKTSTESDIFPIPPSK